MLIFVFLFASSSLGLAVAECPTVSTSQCSAPKISKVKFSYTSYQNQSGQWLTQIGLQHDGGQGASNKTNAWSLDVEQTSATSCDGDVTIDMLANIAAPFLNSRALPNESAPLPKWGPDYELFPGIGYYKFHTDATTWPAARQKCADEGAHLAVINSESESEVMKKLFVLHPTIVGAESKEYAWIGVERKDGKYLTIFGDALETTGFTRWSPGEPHKTASENCILVNRGSGGLADVHCTWKVAFICEHEL